ncbi:MAG: FkbM family methyltransferase [Halobaculum sp.]
MRRRTVEQAFEDGRYLTGIVQGVRYLWTEAYAAAYLWLLRASPRSSDGLVPWDAGDYELLVDLSDPGLSKQLLVDGPHEPAVVSAYREVLSPGATVVDVGANIGYYALLAAATVGPSGEVHAVEPVRANAEILDRAREHNGFDNVTIHEVGLGATDGTRRIRLAPESNLGTMVALDSDRIDDDVGRSIAEGSTGTDEVQTRSLDSLAASAGCENWDVVRMDVQGMEPDVIEGMSRTAATVDPPAWVFVEVHTSMFDDVPAVVGSMIDTLTSRGFEPQTVITGSGEVIDGFDSVEAFVAEIAAHDDRSPYAVLVNRGEE